MITHAGAIQQQVRSHSAKLQWSNKALQHIAMLRQNGFTHGNDVANEDIPETCNDDFELGTENSNECNPADPGKQDPVDEEAMCMRAATAANVTAPRTTFVIHDSYYDKRPAGCFMFSCSEDPKGVCFFYNNNPETPRNPQGTPVCLRNKYVNGTKDTKGGCPEGYENLLDIASCRKASKCWTWCDEDSFDVNAQNNSKYHDYPQGCFINEKTNCFAYNTIKKSMGEPSNPHGMPVCVVSQQLHWPDSLPSFGKPSL